MYELPQWPNKNLVWTHEKFQLLDEPETFAQNVTLEEFLCSSENFPIKFPIDAVRCKILKNSVNAQVIENYINSAYPLIHENALQLYATFLLHKQQFGTLHEKKLYKNMSVLKFVDRLLSKRAVMFMGKFDQYILLDGTKGSGKWNLIGKDNNQSKLTLENCLSYDEIKLSVFLSVSSLSYFINNGTRKNYGKPAINRNNMENEGVIIGLIGARLRKIGVMEYEEMVITKTQNSEQNGYGLNKNSLHKVFAEFYEEPCFTYQQVLDLQNNILRFASLGNDTYFDNIVFSKRIALSIDTLLIEANERATLKNTTAYIHVVGIGLGVWKCSDHQQEVFVETFAKRLQALGNTITAISDIYFSYFEKVSTCGGYKSGDLMKIIDHPLGIRIFLGKRDPHNKLTGVDTGKLLIVSYAWDGNSLPGNEFWSGKLGSTGDSAAAASTQISEIHNPHINSKVCAANLRIVTILGLKMFKIPEWPVRPIWTEETLNALLKDAMNDAQKPVTLEELQEKSDKFPIKFPVDSVRCKTLINTVPKEKLEANINSVYPVIHENVLQLMLDFLYHKVRFGKEPEREIYKNMTVLELVERLLTKRAVSFLNDIDSYALLNGTRGFGQWERIGTDSETEKLNLKTCLSYDEIKLSVFLSVSSFTTFINDGNRYNCGVLNRVNVEPEGIIIGLIGTRFEKPDVMEYEEIVISESQNHQGNGYGILFLPTKHGLFSGFYGELSFVYHQALELKKTEPTRFTNLSENMLFDNKVYCKRIILSIETLLFEAQQRAKERCTTAFVHVVGLGLGVWKISPHQTSLFLDTFVKRLEVNGKHLNAVSDVVFAHFGHNGTVGGYKNNSIVAIPGHPNNGIKVQLSNRLPHTKMTGENEGKLLVVSYAWDGNALPGNEFWNGSLTASGDPAAASSTQIAELHNPHINSKVTAKNLRVAGPFGVISFSKYRDVAMLNSKM
ncbi:hypothetical protein RN001_001711 [Aquatica leii]|uniref:Uncharacterized protein n=1 Tax=Aquatica leii TaxID=1421715 RepID=A0AAN7QAL1_9COLE|nr:hypothetical protein RN001_001711 [Aquatica leii]